MKKVNPFFLQQNSIHPITRPILVLARCFGIFPVKGLLEKTPKKLRFVLKSPYTLMVVLSLSGQFLLTFLGFLNLFESGITPRTFQKFVSNAGGFICVLLVIKMAIGWPKFVHEINLIEKDLPKFSQKNVAFLCNFAAGGVFLCAVLELALGSRFYTLFVDACPQDGATSLTESYYKYFMPAAAARIPYSVFNFIMVQTIIIQMMFVSNFADVLIIVISIYLSAYFEELNGLVNLYKNKTPALWNVLRVHYTKLTRLVKIVDDTISPFILFSFGVNMVIICIQLFKILRRNLAHATGDNCDEKKLHATLKSIDRSLYLNFSTVFLIARAILTALFATRVHSTARAPLNTLYEVPSYCYNSEAQRFVEQIHSSTIALSGQHFFYVTRKMILTMVATIFTYELVLLQFST